MDTSGFIIGSKHPYGCSCWTCRNTTFTDLLKEVKPTADFRHELEMAGVKKEKISVKRQGGTVKVSWTTRLGESRHIPFPVGDKYYDMEKLSVKYEDGMLQFHCPLKPEVPQDPPQEPEIDIEIK